MMNTNEDKLRLAAATLGHVVGVSVLSVASLVLFLGEHGSAAATEAIGHQAFVDTIWFGVAVHVGLAACAWAMLVIAWKLVTGERDETTVVRVMNRRGSVMTETIIVLPVFLMIFFGLAQLAIVNVAGILTNVAAFQAARAAWVWQPEAEVNRRGTNPEMVRQKARLQAAAVLAPAAPGSYSQDPLYDDPARMRGAFYGFFQTSAGADTGHEAMGHAAGESFEEENNYEHRGTSLGRALDESSFPSRTSAKFTTAWHATQVEIIEEDDKIGALVTYRQICVVPMVARIFGRPMHIGGERVVASEIRRRFLLHKQKLPNSELPHT
jgi:hypothetical protein